MTIPHFETPRRLLKAAEVGHALGLGRSKVYQLLQTGELPSVRIGRSRRVRAEALDEYLARLDANGSGR